MVRSVLVCRFLFEISVLCLSWSEGWRRCPLPLSEHHITKWSLVGKKAAMSCMHVTSYSCSRIKMFLLLLSAIIWIDWVTWRSRLHVICIISRIKLWMKTTVGAMNMRTRAKLTLRYLPLIRAPCFKHNRFLDPAKALQLSNNRSVYVFADSDWKCAGRFWPHRSFGCKKWKFQNVAIEQKLPEKDDNYSNRLLEMNVTKHSSGLKATHEQVQVSVEQNQHDTKQQPSAENTKPLGRYGLWGPPAEGRGGPYSHEHCFILSRLFRFRVHFSPNERIKTKFGTRKLGTICSSDTKNFSN